MEPNIQEVLRIQKEADQEFLRLYCDIGAYLAEGGDTINGVCRNVGANEVLNFMHVTNAKIIEALKNHENN